METKEWNFIDKSEWARGEWDSEPDKMQWPDPETGLPCLMHRGPHGGWCGYPESTYKSLDYVRAECTQLAKQLKALA